MSELEVTQAALTGEHAAIYAYGVIGALLNNTEQSQALLAMNAHRLRRDTLAQRVVTLGGTPVQSSAAYDLPITVSDTASARQLAAFIDDRCAGLQATLAGASSGAERTAAVTSSQANAVRSVSWSGVSPVWYGSN